MTRMHEHEIGAVRELYEACHPTWPKRSDTWFESVNSLVIRSKGRVIAWTAYTLAPPPSVDLASNLGPGATVCWLVDTCVAADFRGQGFAGILMDQRVRAAELCGCCMVLGACADDNKAMRSLLASRGFEPVGAVEFPDGPGQFYLKRFGV
jgi:GNAT superfamily N-acetyltransferase